MEDTVIIKKKFELNREINPLSWNQSLNQRTNGSRASIIIIITVLFAFTNNGMCAQAGIENVQKIETKDRMSNQNVAESESESGETFTVDNNTYKVINEYKEDNVVMFWSYEDLDNSEKYCY